MFSRLNFNLPDDIIQGVVASKPGVIEFILANLRNKVSQQHPSESTYQRQTGVDLETYTYNYSNSQYLKFMLVQLPNSHSLGLKSVNSSVTEMEIASMGSPE